MQRKEDWSALTRSQRFGYWLVRLLGTLQAVIQTRLIGEPVWRSAMGVCTPVSKLSSGHLHNALRMVQRSGDQPELLQVLHAEYARRLSLLPKHHNCCKVEVEL
jgi:hypothetical protein